MLQNGRLKELGVRENVSTAPVPHTFGEYRQQLEQGLREPQPNAATILLRALSRKPIERLSLTEVRFGVLEEHLSSAIFGMYETMAQLWDELSTAARTGSAKKTILLVGDKGSGKSSLITLIKNEVASYVAKHPPLVLEDCPVNDSPDVLFEHTEKGPCPDCARKLLQLGNTVKEGEDPRDKMGVQLQETSGIATVSPTFTTATEDWQARSYWSNTVMQGSILTDIPELGKQGNFVLHEMDYFRGIPWRIIATPQGQIFEMGNVVIAETTTQEYNALFADMGSTTSDRRDDRVHEAQRAPFVDRLVVIRVGPNRRVEPEVKAYEQMLKRADLGRDAVHQTPSLIEALAEIAVRSRFVDSRQFPNMTAERKFLLHNGGLEEEVSREVELALAEEAPRIGEGQTGISPAIMDGLLTTLFNRARELGYTNPYTREESIGCVDYSDAFKAMKAVMGERAWSQVGESVVRAYEESLKTVVIDAFGKKYEPQMKFELTEYMDALDNFFNFDSLPTPDSIGSQPKTKDEFDARLTAFENETVFKDMKVSDETRSEFRGGFFHEMTALAKEIDPEGYVDIKDIARVLVTEYKPWYAVANRLVRGVRRKVTGSEERPEEMLRMLHMHNGNIESVSDTDVQQRLREVKQELLAAEQGFCPCCVNRVMARVAAHV